MAGAPGVLLTTGLHRASASLPYDVQMQMFAAGHGVLVTYLHLLDMPRNPLWTNCGSYTMVAGVVCNSLYVFL